MVIIYPFYFLSKYNAGEDIYVLHLQSIPIIGLHIENEYSYKKNIACISLWMDASPWCFELYDKLVGNCSYHMWKWSTSIYIAAALLLLLHCCCAHTVSRLYQVYRALGPRKS